MEEDIEEEEVQGDVYEEEYKYDSLSVNICSKQNLPKFLTVPLLYKLSEAKNHCKSFNFVNVTIMIYEY